MQVYEKIDYFEQFHFITDTKIMQIDHEIKKRLARSPIHSNNVKTSAESNKINRITCEEIEEDGMQMIKKKKQVNEDDVKQVKGLTLLVLHFLSSFSSSGYKLM